MHPKVYDLNLNLVAILENAFAIGYEMRLNELWTAHFSLPADDPKVAECQALRFVEIFDGDERVDLFRIVPTKTERSDSGKTITYQLEHVLATLLDDVLFQYHERVGLTTTDVLTYILARQSTARWQLGTVNFAYQFSYKWENENLLAACFSVPKPFLDEYCWTWDTSSYPWTLNLIAASAAEGPQIRYRKNLRGVTKEEDPTQVCTRLYVLGYGEGVNQLDIREINPTGQPYIDADTQATYGVIARVWTDRRYEHAETLYQAGRALLEQLKVPRVVYTAQAADLYRLTQDPVDKFQLGASVQVTDDELGFDFTSRVVGLAKGDVTGAPGDITISIANQPQDIAGSIAELADRTRINEVYAQGATNLDSHDYADNADAANPAVIRFYLPEETVRINKMALSYDVSAFRAYSKAIEGGGAIATSTAAGGGISTSTGAGGGTTATSGADTWYYDPGYGSAFSVTSTDGDHNHGGVVGSDGGHTHALEDVNHTHDITLQNHAHDIELGDHDHDISLPDHTHGIDYGIYLGPTPADVTVEVDGNAIPGLGLSETDVDIIPYLAKDAEGKINRGVWHEITITPDNLGRIIANVVTQLFVQSRGGGDY